MTLTLTIFALFALPWLLIAASFEPLPDTYGGQHD